MWLLLLFLRIITNRLKSFENLLRCLLRLLWLLLLLFALFGFLQHRRLQRNVLLDFPSKHRLRLGLWCEGIVRLLLLLLSSWLSRCRRSSDAFALGWRRWTDLVLHFLLVFIQIHRRISTKNNITTNTNIH